MQYSTIKQAVRGVSVKELCAQGCQEPGWSGAAPRHGFRVWSWLGKRPWMSIDAGSSNWGTLGWMRENSVGLGA